MQTDGRTGKGKPMDERMGAGGQTDRWAVDSICWSSSLECMRSHDSPPFNRKTHNSLSRGFWYIYIDADTHTHTHAHIHRHGVTKCSLKVRSLLILRTSSVRQEVNAADKVEFKAMSLA